MHAECNLPAGHAMKFSRSHIGSHMRLIGDLYDLLLSGEEGRYGSIDPMRRLHTWAVGNVLYMLTCRLLVETSCHFGSGRRRDAGARGVLLEPFFCTRKSARCHASSRVILSIPGAWSTTRGNGEGRLRSLGTGFSKLLFATETPCQLNVTSPAGYAHARFSTICRGATVRFCAGQGAQH